ncbi:MAG TPA: hypothetical protein ENI94_02800 [Gammaproteobacteria bacterium]|nr:hypothetical protein [Gammaproteobacteria bacterium]
MNKLGRFCIATLWVVAPFSASGGEIGEIQWHGFLTGAYLATSGSGEDIHYTGDISDNGTTKDTRLGLTVTTQVDEKWRFAAQMKAKGVEDFQMEMDWAYATYDYSDGFAVNVGEIKYPVGLYNEYIEVGYTYPWIRAPETFYNLDTFGPNMTRISYSGVGLVFTSVGDESETDFNIFGGLLDVPDGHVNQLIGAKLGFNWADMLRLQISVTTGLMEIEDDLPRAAMNGERHTSFSAGIGLDMESFVFSAEIGTASMGVDDMETTTGYAMMGYRFGDFMPHVTYGHWDVKGGWGQKDITLGLRTELTSNTALKIDVKQVKQGGKYNNDVEENGYGLFNEKPEEDKVLIYGVALELVF